MLVFYNPFRWDEKNDIAKLAVEFLIKIPHKKEIDSVMVQHGDEFLLGEEPLIIYIFGHGNGLSPRIASVLDDDDLDGRTLSMQELARRYQTDFMHYHHQVTAIKLYFCNIEGTEEQIAKKFSSYLLHQPERIDYYTGAVSTSLGYLYNPQFPQLRYHKIAFQQNGTAVRASTARRSLFFPEIDVEIEVNWKKAKVLNSFAMTKEKRKNNFFEIRKEKKLQKFIQARLRP